MKEEVRSVLSQYNTLSTAIEGGGSNGKIRDRCAWTCTTALPNVQNNDNFLPINLIKCHCFAHAAGGDAPSSTQFEVAVASCGGIFNIIMYRTIN